MTAHRYSHAAVVAILFEKTGDIESKRELVFRYV